MTLWPNRCFRHHGWSGRRLRPRWYASCRRPAPGSYLNSYRRLWMEFWLCTGSDCATIKITSLGSPGRGIKWVEDPLEETCYQRLLSRDFSPNSHNKQHVNLPHVYLLEPASHLVKCGKIVKVISVLIIFLRGRMGSCSRMESLGVARHTLCRCSDQITMLAG